METSAAFTLFSLSPIQTRSVSRRPAVIGQRYSLLILSEIRIVWETLAEALRRQLRFANISGVSSLAEASVQISVADPEMVLIDATMRSALAAALWLHQRDPDIRLIAFNMDEAEQANTAWTKVGAVACIGRAVTLKAIVELVGTLINGEPAADTSAVVKVDSYIPTTRDRLIKEVADTAVALTPREEEVVKLVIAGESNKEIARILKISLPTVKSHVHNLLAKLGLERRGKLALCYQGRPLVTKQADTRTTVSPAGQTNLSRGVGA